MNSQTAIQNCEYNDFSEEDKSQFIKLRDQFEILVKEDMKIRSNIRTILNELNDIVNKYKDKEEETNTFENTDSPSSTTIINQDIGKEFDTLLEEEQFGGSQEGEPKNEIDVVNKVRGKRGRPSKNSTANIDKMIDSGIVNKEIIHSEDNPIICKTKPKETTGVKRGRKPKNSTA